VFGLAPSEKQGSALKVRGRVRGGCPMERDGSEAGASTGVEVVRLDQDRMKTKPIKMPSLKQGAVSTNVTVTPSRTSKRKRCDW